MNLIHKRTIFIDYDGVIADSLLSKIEKWKALIKIFNKKKVELSPELVRNLWKGDKKDFYKRVLGFNEEEAVKSISIFHTFVGGVFESDIFPGMDIVLKTLAKENNLVVVSSESYELVNNFLKRYELLDLFQDVYGAENSGGFEKPDKRVLEIPIKKYNLLPSDCVMVGDGIGDILVAKNSGVRSVACLWGWGMRSDLEGLNPDFLAQKPQDLLTYFYS